MTLRVVIESNVYVSRLLKPSSIPGRAVINALDSHQVLVSRAILLELRGVLMRRKIASYIGPGSAEPFLRLLSTLSIPTEPSVTIRACRDPKDDKFLEVAVYGHADVIVSGDRDLLDLHPFRGVSILTPAAYLTRVSEDHHPH